MLRKGRMLLATITAALCAGTLIAAVACSEDPVEPKPEGNTYTVTYTAGYTGATDPDLTESHKEGEQFTLRAADAFSRGGGYTFTKWSDGSVEYDAGASYTMPARNVTFTAQWTEAEPEELPDGTITQESVPQGTLQTTNGNAKAHWTAEYQTEGLVITAWVEDGTVYAKGGVSANDGIVVLFAQSGRTVGYTEKTISVRVDAAGNTAVRNMYEGDGVEIDGLTTDAKYFTVDGETLAGYRVIITMPYGDDAAGFTLAAHDASVALGVQNASNAANGTLVYEETYGTDPEQVHTYMTVAADGTFAANPYVEIGTFWGDGGAALPADTGWNTSGDDDTDNAHIVLESHNGDNNIYMTRSGAIEFYAEVQLHADSELLGNDQWPKFGMQIVKADKSAGYSFFVDAVATEDGGNHINSGSADLGYAHYTGTWGGYNTITTKAGANSSVYTGDNAYITMGIYRKGSSFQLYLDGSPLDAVTMSDVGENDIMYAGLFSFKVKLTAKGYKVEKENLDTYRTTLEGALAEHVAEKTIDGNLEDWTTEQTKYYDEIIATNGRSVKVYATLGEKGVYVFYDALHEIYKDDSTDWSKNTNAEFWIGRKQYHVTANEHTITEAKFVTSQEGGLHHTKIEGFLAYDAIQGYTAESEYALMGFAFKTENEVGALWCSGDWWRTDDMNDRDQNGEGFVVTRNGIKGEGASDIYTVDGELTDWEGADWQNDGRAKWAASLEEDGVYMAVKFEQADLPERNIGRENSWYLNQNIELQGSDNYHGGKVFLYNGQTYHSAYITAAKAKLTQSELVFELFIAREQLTNVSAEAENAKFTMGGQLYPEATEGTDHWQVYFTNKEVWAPRWTVTFENEYGTETTTTQKVVKGKSVTLTEPDAHEGWTFDGWYKEGTKVDLGQYTPEGDVTLTAKWNPVAPTITFEPGGDATGSPSVVPQWNEGEKNYTITLPAGTVYTWEDHDFDQWSVSVNGSENTYDANAQITVEPGATVVITAKWTQAGVVTHKVEFKLGYGDNETYQTRTVTEGETVGVDNMPTPPVREGYRFEKWLKPDGEDEFTANTEVSANIEVKASWIEQAKVTFELDGGVGDPPAPIWIDKNKTLADMAEFGVTMPEDTPARAAYKFEGWKLQSSETEFNESYTVTENITVVPKWKNLVDGVLDWTDEQKTNPFIMPASNGMKVTVYGYLDDFGVWIYYDVLHTVHKTTETDWFNNTNIEFRLGGNADKQYAKNSKGDYINSIQEQYIHMHTDDPSGNSLYNTKAEVFVPYEDVGNGYNKNSAYVPARFMFKVGGLDGALWVGGDWWRPEDTAENGNQGTLITRNGILKAQDKSVTIDGDESEWAGAQWTNVPKGGEDDRTIQWTYKFGTDGMYFAFKAEGSNLATEREFYNGDGWKNQNVEIQAGVNSHRSIVAYIKGETYHTMFINEAKAKFTAAADNGGEKDKLVYEIFIAYPNLIDVNAESQSMTFNSGTQLFKTTDGVEANVWTVLATGATLTRQA